MILPCSPVKSGESKIYRARGKNCIRKGNKIRERNSKDKAHHAVLESVHIQIMIIQTSKSSIAYHDTIKLVCIQRISIQAEDSSRVHHGTF